MMSVVNIISLNARGLADLNKRKSVLEFYTKRCSILCLQETHATEGEVQKYFEQQWQGVGVFSNGTSSARGVCILVKRCLNAKIIQPRTDTEGRFVPVR